MKKLFGRNFNVMDARTFFRRGIALLFVVALLAGTLPQGFLSAEAATAKQRTIGILFDNSGSMYADNAWCRAIYAMEVFASMANDGDRILIYSMHPMEVNGETYTYNKPLEFVAGEDDPALIRQIYTPSPGETPIEAVEAAYESLSGEDGDETWFVILTDGTEFYRNEVDLADTAAELTGLLSTYNETMNILYLGIGENAAEPTLTGTERYAGDVKIVSDSSEVLKSLTEMCNTIYGRDELAVSDAANRTVEFDVSMSKIILFVQGSNITSLKLVDEDGNEVSEPTSAYTPCCRMTKGQGKTTSYYDNMSYDESLKGAIVTYENLEAGTYTLQYDGTATSVGVYYEPDVSVVAYLTDADGNVVDTAEDIYPGTYYLCYELVDSNGQPTESALLGSRYYAVTCVIDGVETKTGSDSDGKVELTLEEGMNVSAEVTVTYLNDYTVSAGTGQDGWIFSLDVLPEPLETLSLSLSGGQASYAVTEFENQAIYCMQVSYGDTLLTGDELESVSLKISFECNGTSGSASASESDEVGIEMPDHTCELSEDGKSLVITLRYPGGDANSLSAGDYTMKVQASYTEEKGNTVTSGTEQASFTVEPYSYTVEATIDAEEYYTLSQLNGGAAITVSLTHDGEPLTEGEMEGAELFFDADGVEYTVEKDAENSQFLVSLSPESGNAGAHTLSATVSVQDELGNTVTAAVTKETELGRMPLWLLTTFKAALAFLTLFLILLLVSLYRNAKVLPKRITLLENGTNYRVQGHAIPNPNIEYARYQGGKKNGEISFTVPPYGGTPGWEFTLQLEAVSPRKEASARRWAQVTGVHLQNGVRELQLGAGVIYEREGETLYWNGSPLEDIRGKNVNLTNGSECIVRCPAYDPVNNMNIPRTLRITLIFE